MTLPPLSGTGATTLLLRNLFELTYMEESRHQDFKWRAQFTSLPPDRIRSSKHAVGVNISMLQSRILSVGSPDSSGHLLSNETRYLVMPYGLKNEPTDQMLDLVMRTAWEYQSVPAEMFRQVSETNQQRPERDVIYPSLNLRPSFLDTEAISRICSALQISYRPAILCEVKAIWQRPGKITGHEFLPAFTQGTR